MLHPFMPFVTEALWQVLFLQMLSAVNFMVVRSQNSHIYLAVQIVDIFFIPVIFVDNYSDFGKYAYLIFCIIWDINE